MMTGSTHWTEAGTNAARHSDAPAARARHLDRQHRVQLVNRILSHYGCTVSDWEGNSYILRGWSGQTAIVEHLPQIWLKVEEICKKPADPLDHHLLSSLRDSAPLVRG